MSPELVNKKLRTLYFRGFPINTRETLLHWMNQQELPEHEDVYTIGSPSDTVAVLFKTETDLWSFLRKCTNNKWILYGSSQIYVGLDNQIRGQNPEHTKAIRKLFRACIEILKEKYPDADVAQTHIYRNYNRGIVKIKNGSDWEEIAHWDFRISKLIFAADDTAYEQLWRDLMRWLRARSTTSRTKFYNSELWYDFLHFDIALFNWHLGFRFGEATHPGPSLSIVSVNVTSILLHFHLFLTYDIVLVQESRLTDYGQTYLQQILNEQGWAGIWSEPRPPQRNDSDSTTSTGKCGGVAILFRQSLQFQVAPQSLLQTYPSLRSHRFLHGILSTESGPTLHFMTVYGYTGADVHAEAQAHNDTLMSSVFEYASGFGNTPVYIGMDANTDNLSSSSLSQVSLSQRWFDIGSHFAYPQNERPSPTCFAKGNPVGRRIDYIFANSPAVNAIQEFTLETAVPIPTHRPLCITILAHLFSSSITRLALPPTTYSFPRPTPHFLNVFSDLFQWDISVFEGDVEQAYSCWNEWAQQYLTLLTNTDFHSRGATPCVRKGLLALPPSRELPASKRPYITLYNRTVSAISEIYTTPTCLHTLRFRTFLSKIAAEASFLLRDFEIHDDPQQWLPQLREALLIHRLTEQTTIQQQRKTAWQSWIKDTWALNSKKIYQLIKGKFVEPFICLQTDNGLITDRAQIDTLLQQAWSPIFAKYPTPEDKASEYRNSFYPHESPFPSFSFPPLTLDDVHYILSKKLKPSAATGLDGWRPSEIKQLPDCILQALLDVFHLCETQGKFPSSFYYSYTTLIPKGASRAPLSLRPITVLPVPYRIYASLRCQTLLKWQHSWIHPSQFAFCKGRSTTSLNSSLSFDLLRRYQYYQSFAGIQFDFAKCFDSIPFSVIWDILFYIPLHCSTMEWYNLFSYKKV